MTTTMTGATEFARRGLAEAERELRRFWSQYQRCRSGGPAELHLIAAGQRVTDWRRAHRSNRATENV